MQPASLMLGALTFAVGVAYMPGILSAATAPRWWLMAIGAAFLCWWVRFQTISSGHWLGVALIGYSAAGLYWSTSPWDTVEGLCALGALGIVFCLAAEAESLNPCWIAVALASWVSAVFVLIQLAGFSPVLAIGPAGLFLTKNMLSEFAVIGLIGAVMLRSPWLTIGPAICLLAPWSLNVSLAGSLEASLSLLAAGVCAMLLLADRWPERIAAMLITVIAVVAMAMVIVFEPRVLLGLMQRFEVWDAAIDGMTLWGSGLNTFADRFPQYEYAHNEFVQIAFELGLFGVLLAIGVIGYALAAPGHRVEKILVSALLACAFVWWPFRAPATAMVVALLAGHLSGARHRAECVEPEGRAYDWARDGLPNTVGPLPDGTARAAAAGRFSMGAGSKHQVVG